MYETEFAASAYVDDPYVNVGKVLDAYAYGTYVANTYDVEANVDDA